MVWETVVLNYLTQQEGMFVFPQLHLGRGDSCPDFVAIHPNRPGKVYIAEVSAAWNLKSLSDRFRNREKYWYEPIRREVKIWNYSQPYEFTALAFIRSDSGNFEITDQNDVVVKYLENIAFDWQPHLQSPSLT